MCKRERVSLLVEGLYGPDKTERAKCMEGLVKCGKPAVLPLIYLLDDGSWVIRYRAAEALGLIGDERAVTALTASLKDDKDHVRYMAAKSLGMFGKKESSISLLPLLRDENEYVRKIVAVSLGSIGSSSSAKSALAAAIICETDPAALEAMKNAIEKMV
ncbi:MAG: HEAT repeat domain-containing protein [Methanomicrobiaceae archaeon]|nr:HEAT repeat domain-containing protein [Methanomicrobiaceae archaeon]